MRNGYHRPMRHPIGCLLIATLTTFGGVACSDDDTQPGAEAGVDAQIDTDGTSPNECIKMVLMPMANGRVAFGTEAMMARFTDAVVANRHVVPNPRNRKNRALLWDTNG